MTTSNARLPDQAAAEIPASRTFSKETAGPESTAFWKDLWCEGINILIAQLARVIFFYLIDNYR